MNHLKSIFKNLRDTVVLSFIGSIDDKGFPNIRAMLRPRQYDI